MASTLLALPHWLNVKAQHDILQLMTGGAILLCGPQWLLAAMQQPKAAVLVRTAVALGIMLRTQQPPLLGSAVATLHCCRLAAALHAAE
jgi:hypothetical protein